jgi:hypothetical protein
LKLLFFRKTLFKISFKKICESKEKVFIFAAAFKRGSDRVYRVFRGFYLRKKRKKFFQFLFGD